MQYTSHYRSPMGGILLAADDMGLTGLWFEGQKYFALHLDKANEEKEVPLLDIAKRWLDTYFSGKEPDFSVPLHFRGTQLGNPLHHPVWAAHVLWGDRKAACRQKRSAAHVRPSSRRGGRTQRDLCHSPLPPGRRLRRQPDRLCRRP